MSLDKSTAPAPEAPPAPKTIPKYRYTLKPSAPILKYHKWTLESKSLPTSVNLVNKYQCPIFDQQTLGSCTANSISAAFSYEYHYQHNILYIPSRLFIYYNERVLEGTVSTDSGASLSDGVSVIEKLGTCPETIWPYDISQYAVKPPEICYTDGLKEIATLCKPVSPTLNDIKRGLSEGHPIIFGMQVPSYLENISSNGFFVPTADNNNQEILGGHAIVFCAYNDDLEYAGIKGFLTVRNSWGTAWGDKGYFYMPYDFLKTGYVSDLWMIELVS